MLLACGNEHQSTFNPKYNIIVDLESNHKRMCDKKTNKNLSFCEYYFIVTTGDCTNRKAVTGLWSSRPSCWTEAALRLMRRVQRGHDRSFQPYSPMGWRVALRSGRVHNLCQRLRSSGSRYARHRSHIQQLRRARTIRSCVWPCELVWRRAWSSKANKRKAHEAPWRPRRVHGYR